MTKPDTIESLRKDRAKLLAMLDEITESFYVHEHDGYLNMIREKSRALIKTMKRKLNV